MTLENPILEMTSYPYASWSRYFTFLTENEVESNWGQGTSDRYALKIENPGPGYPDQGYRGIINIGEDTDDGYTWSRIGTYYSTFTPAAPPPVGCRPGKCPVPIEIDF